MSLKVLLRCSDEEFEKLIALMDIEAVLDLISELQREMDREQEKFDRLSASIAYVTDQSSAHFKKLSAELVKSQNMLALLVARNMHCFKVSTEPEEDALPADSLDSIIYDLREDNSCGDLRKDKENISENRPQRMTSNDSMTSNGTSFPVATSTDKPSTKPTNSESNRIQSTATLTVISPRNPSQEVKPKRVLKVRTASLSAGVAGSHGVNTQISSTEVVTCTSDSLPGNRQYADRRLSQIETDNLQTSWSSPSPSPLTYFSTPTAVSPSSIALSPRSDISNLATPRSLIGTPRLPVSTILDLDMPETSIDEADNPKCSPAKVGEAVSDRISYTTDESGFTSASSDSDTTLLAPDIVYDYLSEEEEKVEERVFMREWSPSKLLAQLYSLQVSKELATHQDDTINMEGYLERMPLGKNKNTLLKTWKRTYCRCVDGIIYFYHRKDTDEAQSCMSLMGGKVEEMSNRMIGIDDMRGHYLMVRCPSQVDYLNWKRCFYTQIKCSPHVSYVRPCLTSTPSSVTPKVIVIDLGSSNIRAGVLGSLPSYPQLFFPSVSSTNAEGKVVFGVEAYEPENRANGLHRPIASCREIDTYRINLQVLPHLFHKIFTELRISELLDYVVLVSTPHNFSSRLKEEVLNILLGQHKVAAVNLVNQSLLTPYIYNATSGIVVDIGERIELVSIIDGYLVDGGLNRQSFGGSRITDNLNSYLVDYRLLTPVEHLITRLVKEQTCFVSQDYGDDLLKYMCNESECQATVDLNTCQLPPNSHFRHITVDTARFKAAEGLIKAELLGVDSPTLPRLIDRAIQKCPLDTRREMWQSIYLSGGTTLTTGFAERLQMELGKIAPSSLTVQVHASPHRYHAAYIGACMLAKLPTFLNSCISREEWNSQGNASLNKWKMYFQG